MTKHKLPSQDALNQRLRYEPETGKLFWKPWPQAPKGWRAAHEGKETFLCDSGNGYLFGTVTVETPAGRESCRMHAHRAIWMMVHGEAPEFVDHINGDRKDNRLCNLRNVTRTENAINKRLRSDNSSGHHGVWLTQYGTWKAHITLGGKMVNIGNYPTKEYALVARKAAERVLGFHKNHGDRKLREG